jgi:RND family efflux transporter MFP subunit
MINSKITIMKHTTILAFIPLALLSCSSPEQQSVGLQSLPVVQINGGNASAYQEFPASIEGEDNVEIRPQVTGVLDHIYVDEGAYVHAGQPLLQINAAPYREKLNNALARLRSAEAALSNAQLEVDKLTPLVENKVVSDYQLKTAETTKEIELGNVEQAKADIASAKINLGYTLIKAPVNGFVGLLPRKEGSLVSPADPASLTNLSDVHDVHVYFALGEFDFIRFKEQYAGQTLADKIKHLPPVDLILANDSTYAIKGKIDMIDGQFDKNTGAITIRATFPNHDGLLRSGNTGKIKLGIRYTNQVMVPQSATLELQDKLYVFLLGDSNKVSKQLILIAGKSGRNYIVKNGLKAGDRIVLTGFDHLHEGDRIQPEKPQKDSVNLVANN